MCCRGCTAEAEHLHASMPLCTAHGAALHCSLIQLVEMCIIQMAPTNNAGDGEVAEQLVFAQWGGDDQFESECVHNTGGWQGGGAAGVCMPLPQLPPHVRPAGRLRHGHQPHCAPVTAQGESLADIAWTDPTVLLLLPLLLVLVVMLLTVCGRPRAA